MAGGWFVRAGGFCGTGVGLGLVGVGFPGCASPLPPPPAVPPAYPPLPPPLPYAARPAIRFPSASAELVASFGSDGYCAGSSRRSAKGQLCDSAAAI
jgi:hypothetical protein